MSLKKCTMIFSQGAYGWTETYWRDNAGTDLNADMTALKDLAPKRIVLSGKQTQLDYLKVSDESIQRDSLVFGYVAEAATQPHGANGFDSDVRFTAALIRRQNELHTATSNLLLRGIWDQVVAGGVLNPNDPDWRPLFNSFAAELISLSKGWGFPAKKASISKKVVISNVTQNANGQLVITVPAATFTGPPWGYKAKVFISGVKGAVLCNGARVVTPTAADSCTTLDRIPIFPYQGGGLLTLNGNEFQKIYSAVPLRAVKRATGRPLFLSRGRARVRKLA